MTVFSHSNSADDSVGDPAVAQRQRDRSEQNRISALKRWGRSNGSAGTAPARRAWLGRFEREADPDGTLTAEERSIRAQRLRRAYMRELALKSARARRATTSATKTKTQGSSSIVPSDADVEAGEVTR